VIIHISLPGLSLRHSLRSQGRPFDTPFGRKASLGAGNAAGACPAKSPTEENGEQSLP